ncbi:MAG TPA: Xaa-Pro peptidase family protein [Nitrososphaerales archaeon]|nr:Xaa-Pro peptidase family protein [Nitrososphaerales archaeon]HUK74660.1 Xaa-Pro peptidase family protein [Nitrososphaerales archaeon]
MPRRGVDTAELRKQKVGKLVALMKREGLDALLLNRIENVRYAADFRPVVSMWFQNSYSSFVTVGGDVVVLTVAGDYTRAKHYMPWVGDMRVMHTLGRAEEVAEVFRDYNSAKVGYDQLGLEGFHGLRKAAKGVDLVDAGGAVAEERAVKLEGEVELMREASKVTEASIRAALGSARAGLREYEIAAEAEYAARKMGAEGMSWSLATFAGPNTGLMTRHDSDRVVRSGEFLIMGYATLFKGYNTDITTTTIIGTPSPAQKRVYTATYDAYSAALKATRPGATTKRLRDAAAEVVDEYGYSEYSFSRIQPILHGVGLNVYEPPWAPEPGRDEPNAKLRAGHVIAIEPCITLHDNLKIGGCRIGETILVKEGGYEVLTNGLSEAHEFLYEN